MISEIKRRFRKSVPDILVEIHSVQEFNQALEESFKRPVLMFKHSLTCPISARAFSEVHSYLNNPDANTSYRLITVQHSYEVSKEAAARLQVHHESPQAILVRDGREVWNASHSNITASSLDEAIRQTRQEHP